jgi:hypothetical protein
MDRRLILIRLVFSILISVGILGVARISPWRPLRIVLNGSGILLVAVTLWSLLAALHWFR